MNTLKIDGVGGIPREITIPFGAGQLVLLVGSSGAGKTTALRAVAAMLAHNANPLGLSGGAIKRYLNDSEEGAGKASLHGDGWSLEWYPMGHEVKVSGTPPPTLPSEVLDLTKIITATGTANSKMWTKVLNSRVDEAMLAERLGLIIPDTIKAGEIIKRILAAVDFKEDVWAGGEEMTKEAARTQKQEWEKIVAKAGEVVRYGIEKARKYYPPKWNTNCESMTVAAINEELQGLVEKQRVQKGVEYVTQQAMDEKQEALDKLPGVNKSLEARELAHAKYEEAQKADQIGRKIIEENKKKAEAEKELEKCEKAKEKADAKQADIDDTSDLINKYRSWQEYKLLVEKQKKLAKAYEKAKKATVVKKNTLLCPCCDAALEVNDDGALIPVASQEQDDIDQSSNALSRIDSEIELKGESFQEAFGTQTKLSEYNPGSFILEENKKKRANWIEEISIADSNVETIKGRIQTYEREVKRLTAQQKTSGEKVSMSPEAAEKMAREINSLRNTKAVLASKIERVSADAVVQQAQSSHDLTERIEQLNSDKFSIEIKDAAQKKHELILMWNEISKLLGATGIRAEVSEKSRDKLNIILKDICDKSKRPVVSISKNWAVAIGGRDAKVCSEGEKWIASSSISIAISFMKKCKIAVIDNLSAIEDPKPFIDKMVEAAKKHGMTIFAGLMVKDLVEAERILGEIPYHWIEKGDLITE